MTPLPQVVILAWGWPRRGLAFAAGVFGVAALAPISFWPAMFVSLVLAVWLLDGASLAKDSTGIRHLWRTFLSAGDLGWWFGFGYFLAGLWWLGSAILFEADQFAWVLPLAVVGLPACLALFMAAAFAGASLFWHAGIGRIAIFAVAIALTEYARAHVLTGFPWNEVGMALGTNGVLSQTSSLVGLHGLTLLTVIVFALPAAAWTATSNVPVRLTPLVLCAVMLACLGSYGVWRLGLDNHTHVPNIRLRLVQPNISQEQFRKPGQREAIVDTYLKLSDRATSPGSMGVSDVTHLIWPESAFPFILSRDHNTLDRIGGFLQRGTVLITGAARVGELDTQPNHLTYYNAMQVVVAPGIILDSYDKVRLVPFGEYIPGNRWFETMGLRQLVSIPGGFEPGTKRRTLNIPNLPPVAPLICYEAIFSGDVVAGFEEEPKPKLFLNISDDGWFGSTPGPYQHFAQAKLRTVEEGLPLVRVASTGISAVVDSYGVVEASLPLGVSDILDANLPISIDQTIYAKYRDKIFISLIGICILLSALARIFI